MLNYLTVDPQKNPDAIIVWLHGLGASGDDLVPVAKSLSLSETHNIQHILLDAPLMPVTLNQGAVMPAWYDLFSLDFGAPQDQAGIENNSIQVEEVITSITERQPSIRKIFIAGFSQGGAIALHIALHGSLRYDGIIGLSTYLPLHDRISTADPERIKNLPIFLAHGIHDDVIPLTYAAMSGAYLERYGAIVSRHEYNTGHTIHPATLADLQQWLNTLLNNTASQ